MRDISAADIRRTDSALVTFGTRHTLSDTLSDTRGIGAARRYLYTTFTTISRGCGGCLRVEYDPAMMPLPRAPGHPPVNVVNVLAWLPGRDTSRVVIVTGHYDSCRCAVDGMDSTSDAPGADDDASGTSDVVELARVFSRRFPGGLGALYHPGLHILHVYRIDRIGRGTDHEPFVALGEPGIRTTERMEALDRQHTPNDVFSHVDFSYSAKIARLNAAVLGAVGEAPGAPDSVRIQRIPPLGQQWRVTWAAEPGAVGYEVLLRGTASHTIGRRPGTMKSIP
ncbi:MAG TPA: M28 family peptidase [Gemmatimonadaceae bacterium]